MPATPGWGLGAPRDAALPLGLLRLSQLRRAAQRPAQRFGMRPIPAGWRLHGPGGRSDRQLAPRLRVSRPTGAAAGRRAQGAGWSWPLPDTRQDAALERLRCPAPPPPGARLGPAWAAVPRARKRPGVPLGRRWPAAQAARPEGFPARWGEAGGAGLGRPAGARPATAPPRRGNALCRGGRPRHPGGASPPRRGAGGAALPRRAGRFPLPRRCGDGAPEAPGRAWCTRTRLGRPRGAREADDRQARALIDDAGYHLPEGQLPGAICP
jgi:hypothetical protein